MRTSVLILLALASISGPGASGCQVTPNLAVVRVATTGDSAAAAQGDPVKLRRGPQEAFAGVRGGFFVVRTTQDWQALWAQAGKQPPMPRTLDTSRSMLVLAVSDSKWTQKLEVKKVVDTGTIVDIWVTETTIGSGCASKKQADASDAVVVDRVDKPVRFMVVDQEGESCGDPPLAEIRCRVGETTWWASEVIAQPGDTVDCEMDAKTRGRFVLVDRVLSLAEAPGGSSAKLEFKKGTTRATFGVDIFGTYAVRAEATDEADRKAHAIGKVVVAPPKSKEPIVQLVWSGFDASDEPDTFPRLVLRAREEGAKGRECSAESPAPGFCEAKKHGAYTNMKLAAPAEKEKADKKVPLSVSYKDERVDKGPLACIHVWLEGQRTAEICDRTHRAADDVWQVGSLDLATGKVVAPEPPAPVPSAAPPAVTKPKPKPKK